MQRLHGAALWFECNLNDCSLAPYADVRGSISNGVTGALESRLSAWLLSTRTGVPEGVSVQLTNGLFISLPIFVGGVLNSILIAGIATYRQPVLAFAAWFAFEIVLGAMRVTVVAYGRRRIAAALPPPRLTAALLSCVWAASVGYGTLAALLSGDWILSLILVLSASAMVCGICLRNYGTPRLAGIMCFLALAPCAVGGIMAADGGLIVISLQLPVYMLTIYKASYSLYHLVVSRMTALHDLERSEHLTDTILRSSPDYTVILDTSDDIVFSSSPANALLADLNRVGTRWLSYLPEEDKALGALMLDEAKAGRSGNLVTYRDDASGQRHWFDLVANRVADGSGRTIVVARDITHQRRSEERALWMAHHDALTGLPNRAVLQNRLDELLANAPDVQAGALLLLDVDNFKAINDTLGHDAGDSLLCTFAARLREAASERDLVARTGGDEFAIVTAASDDEAIEQVASRIFQNLREPFTHEGRLFECGASIGASLIPRDGTSRSEIMKAADIALYAVKAGGRAHVKVFEPSMLAEVERHQTMIAAARKALQLGSIYPFYQPKVSLHDERIVGFEALLRWRDGAGFIHGPDVLSAGFDDPALAGPISDRILTGVLDDIARWRQSGVDFGHIAINVSASDFRRGSFAEHLLEKIEEHAIPPDCLQIEVTETVFLGRGAGYVEHALRHLSKHGVRIALDDFGTGYASLSHLKQFPVDLLKIDRSFIREIGHNSDAEAIAATVVNLGHSLGLEVIAEGIETAEQKAYLTTLGCDTGQGYLYSEAVPGADVPSILSLAKNWPDQPVIRIETRP